LVSGNEAKHFNFASALELKVLAGLLNMSEETQRLCDHCGKKPPKGLIQFDGYFEVVCLGCSKEYYKGRPESQHIEYESVRSCYLFPEVPED
jgi:hypothetical protein